MLFQFLIDMYGGTQEVQGECAQLFNELFEKFLGNHQISFMIIDELFKEGGRSIPERVLTNMLRDQNRVEYLLQLAVSSMDHALFGAAVRKYLEIVEIDKLLSSTMLSS